jgi:hypothetical protein
MCILLLYFPIMKMWYKLVCFRWFYPVTDDACFVHLCWFCVALFHFIYIRVSYLSCCLTTNSMFFLSAAVFKLFSKDSCTSQCLVMCEGGGVGGCGLSARKRPTWSTKQMIMHGGIWGGFDLWWLHVVLECYTELESCQDPLDDGEEGYNVFFIYFKEVWFNVVYMFQCTWAMIMPLLLLYLVTKYRAVLYPKNRLLAYYVGVSLIHTIVIHIYITC